MKPRVIRVTVVQNEHKVARYDIPEFWIMGFCATHPPADPLSLFAEAITHWIEQEHLARTL